MADQVFTGVAAQPPFDPEKLVPSRFILSLPKAELHLHLEGAVTPEDLRELRRKQGVKRADPEEIAGIFRYQDFTGFLKAFKSITEHLRSGDDFEFIACRLAQRLAAENVRHAEVTVSAGVVLVRQLNFDDVVSGLERGRERAEREFGVSLLWIFDAVRQFGPEHARQTAEIAVRYRDQGVVAFGIGGDERVAGPELFREVYAHCAGHGLHLTAHAGETVGPESIRGALDILGAERIGHGLSAVRDAELMARLREQQVPMEVCVTSNLCTGCCSSPTQHPLRTFFDSGLLVTLNSDDPGLFRTSLAREYQLAQTVFAFSDAELKQLAANAWRASFLPEEHKREFLAKVQATAS